MSKKKKSTNLIALAVIFFIAGLFVGQFLHMPSLDDYNLLGAMSRGSHHREI